MTLNSLQCTQHSLTCEGCALGWYISAQQGHLQARQVLSALLRMLLDKAQEASSPLATRCTDRSLILASLFRHSHGCRYEDIAEASFGKLGRELMTTVLYTELVGTCALFLILQKGVLRLDVATQTREYTSGRLHTHSASVVHKSLTCAMCIVLYAVQRLYHACHAMPWAAQPYNSNHPPLHVI